jgi:hypothetical protein
VWDIINVSVADSTSVLLVLKHLLQLSDSDVVAFSNFPLTATLLAVMSVFISVSSEVKF